MEMNGKLAELAKKASSAEEAVKLAAENGYSVTIEEAEKYMSFLKGNGPMADDDLEAIAGGMDGKGQEDPPAPRFSAGQTLWVGYVTSQNFMKVTVDRAEFYSEGKGWRYLVTNEYGNADNYYLETEPYLMTTDPKGKWPF